MLADGSINPGEMTSFNHYAFGAVADWMHRCVAGLDLAEIGYRKLRVRPRPGGGLNWAKARHLTPYGEACVAWRLADGTLELQLTVPPNATAEVTLPSGEQLEVGSGTHAWTTSYRPPVDMEVARLDSSLQSLRTMPVAWAAITDAARAHDAALFDALMEDRAWLGLRTLRDVLHLHRDHQVLSGLMTRVLDGIDRP
jgi:alpha-L-rhamnosidase